MSIKDEANKIVESIEDLQLQVDSVLSVMERDPALDEATKKMKDAFALLTKARLNVGASIRALPEGRTARQWSKSVQTHWSPPEGFFEGSAEQIAKGLKANSDSLQQAMSRLNFYVNRAGSNLSSSDKARLEAAKKKLHNLYEP